MGFFFVGIVAIFLGVYKIIVYLHAKKKYLTVCGIINEYDSYIDSSSDTSFLSVIYTPIITYTVDGVEYKIKSSKKTFLKKTVKSWVGKNVELYYNPKNPNKAIEVGYTQGFWWLFYGIIFTAIFTFICFRMV